jgi:hypothetical protein
MTYGNVNVDTVTTSTPNGILGAGNASIMKNRIINGAMVINQRGSSSYGTGVYTLDRWQALATQASKYTVGQNAGSVTPPTGFPNYLGVTSSSAYSVGATDYFYINQNIEGYNWADLNWGSANAKTVTLSAWVYSSLTGTFGGSLLNWAGNYSYPFTYSIPVANTWTQISVTIAGPTAGTWVGATNGGALQVYFSLGTGSTYSGTAGSWSANYYGSATGAVSVVGTNGATFYITGVQLEVGSSATGFEYENYTSLLSKCQRYYWTNTGSASIMAIGVGGFPTTSRCDTTTSFPVQMRTIPSVSFTGTPAIDDYYSVSGNVSSVAATYLTQNGGVVVNNMAVSTFVSGRVGRYTLGSGAYAINYSAEL